MRPETKKLLDKVERVITTSSPQHKRVSARWISLANRKLHRLIEAEEADNAWGIVGASMALAERWREKFGEAFVPISEPVTFEENFFIVPVADTPWREAAQHCSWFREGRQE